MRCEDYPCCGHTNDDPCGPQSYDAPGYYDTTIRGNEHALCDHEIGECNVDYYDDEQCGNCGSDDPEHDPETCYDGYDDGGMEDQWLDGSYEE